MPYFLDSEVEKNIEFLGLFIKKADELKKFSYFDKKESIVTMKILKLENGKGEVKFSFPNDEQKKALLLTLRMFIQKNDRIYFRKFLDFYTKVPFSRKWKYDVWDIIFNLDMRLERVIFEGKEKFTRKDLFEIFLYGDEGHLTQRKKFKELVYCDDVKELHESTFHEVIIDYSSAIFSLANITRKELKRLQITIPDSL